MSKIYKRQIEARGELDTIWKSPEQVNVIHYSCESFYDRPDGTSPRITSIAVRNLKTGQTQSFSIHKFGELRGLSANQLTPYYNELEKEMLDAFFALVIERKEYKWIHWNMRDENFGFHAIEQRYKILKGQPFVIPDDKKFDLARIMIGIYGKDYVPHRENGRMHTLIEMNNIRSRSAKTGAEEAALFENGDYVSLHQSTLAKVDTLASICQLAHEGILKTTAKWIDLHGHSLKAFVIWFSNHPYILFLIAITSIIINLWFFAEKL